MGHNLLEGWIANGKPPLEENQAGDRVESFLESGAKVAIHNLVEDVVVVSLPEQAQQTDELELLADTLRKEFSCHVVVDFSRVKMLTSQTVSTLMTLLRLVGGHKRRLILCGVSPIIKGIFARTGLEKLFEFADHRSVALQRIGSESRLPV